MKEIILAEKIKNFLNQYANIRPDYDPAFDSEDERFTSPDASILFAAQIILSQGRKLPTFFYLDSSWSSGGYAPYTSVEGKFLHDQIVLECRQLKE